MTTMPLIPKGLNSWKDTSMMVALAFFAAETIASLDLRKVLENLWVTIPQFDQKMDT